HAIQKNGLMLDAEDGVHMCRPTLATDRLEELPELDLCLLCVKSYDLPEVTERLRSTITERTMILPLLNGVDIYERIRSVIESGVVFPSCVYVGTHIEKPGTVRQRGGSCMIHFGNDPARPHVDPFLFTLMDESAIAYNWTDNPYTEIWGKFIFIAAFGMVTAASGKTLGEVRQSPELSAQVNAIMNEIAEIARAKQVRLSPTIISDSFAKAGKFPFEAKTSFQRDYENMTKPDERDIFGGTIIRLGKQFGIRTDATDMIYARLRSDKRDEDHRRHDHHR
ncbi:MAG TPA: 2-dehydropantoate 2-reductase, partial [Spirochaetia bacterium]|nr:2-dehydropantoate 2-reductase [Spirochaetia bacterium]